MSKLRSSLFSWKLAALVVGVGLVGFTWAPAPDCRQQLLTAYHRLLGVGTAAQPGVYHLRFSSTSRVQAPGQRAPQQMTSQGELFCQGKHCYLQTERLRFWQDERYVATVLPSQRTVLLTRAVPRQGETADPQRLLGLRDSLLSLGAVRQCVTEPFGTQVWQHISLAYAGATGRRYHLQQLDCWLDAARTLQQVRVTYRPDGPVRETTLRFPVQEWLSTSDKLPPDARRAVLTTQGQLLPAYRGYRLVNQIPPGQ